MSAHALGKDDDVARRLRRMEAGDDVEPLLTVPEVAAWLRVRPSTVYTWVESGRLTCIRLSGRIRFVRNDILRWIEARREA
jgi:excisionase family DNA binding protein